MRRECREFQAQLIDLAEGRAVPTAQAHVQSCDDCQKRVAQFQMLIGSLGYPLLSAPEGWKDRVPMETTVRRARLLTGRSLLAARSVVEDIQLVLGSEDIEIRVVYMPQADGVRVMARLPGDNWQDESGAGRVDFVAADEGSTGFLLTGPEGERLEIPSLSELRNDESNDAR